MRAAHGRAMFFAIFLVACVCTAVVSCGQSGHSTDETRAIDQDKAELIRLTLERALVAGEIPAYQLISDKQNVVLSTLNIGPELVPELPGVNLIVLEPQQIQEKADAEGDFLHLCFSQVEIAESEATVSLDNIWAVAEWSEQIYLCGGGFTITYHRGLEGWTPDEEIQMWMS